MEPSPNRERRIRILPDRLANLIAAGEVVERPSAVVKELVENAIDAGATTVAIELEAGGRRRIQVVDDGCGMNADDAVLALERHATSKIADPRDLDAIASYGFRGEALPSVAAVSKLQLQTCNNTDGIGTEVFIEGGQLRSVKEVGRARGTTVTVRNLFFNTPARRKFLRTDQTELRHCTREVTGLALGAPEVGITLTHNGRTLFECRPNRSWQDRAIGLFGREIIQRGVELDHSHETGRVYGLLGRPGDAGGGYRDQYLLVNGRSIQARTLRKAILDAYENTLESGSQPFFLIFVDIDPGSVDVNVHPQKREVRFRDERAVYTFVRGAITAAFSGFDIDRKQSASTTQDDGKTAEPLGVAHFWRDARNTFVDRPSRVSDISRTSPSPSSNTNVPPQRKPQSFEDRDAVIEPLRTINKKQHDDTQTSLRVPRKSDLPSEQNDQEEIALNRDTKFWQFQNKYIFA
ncbi:MAG TPA: DNA mismatch repair endonuclease MutL, partial [Firmicutes bacterium]|nr:DNA mismatch repair endonuclease MutL [Bacillota bacterium]